MKSIKDLLDVGGCTIAEMPAENPREITAPRYTVALIEHDYPARTAVMWNAAYRAFDFPLQNVMLVGSASDARHTLAALKADQGYLGGGAGVGFKDEVVEHLDELDETAKRVGAVNFILKTHAGNLRGYNTDGLGFAEGLESVFLRDDEMIAGKKVVFLGAGATGNAIAFALANKGVRMTILNRTEAKAKQLAERVNSAYGRKLAAFGGEDDVAREIQTAHAIVNVSTKGAAGEFEQYSALAPARLPANADNIAANHKAASKLFSLVPVRAVVCDIVLGTKPTPFIEEATQRGYRTMDGIPMVVNQGVEAFWILHSEDLKRKGLTKRDVREVMAGAAKK